MANLHTRPDRRKDRQWDALIRRQHDLNIEPPEQCVSPDCVEDSIYLGLCRDHAAEEVGPRYPSPWDLL